MDQKSLGISPVLYRLEIYWITEKVLATFSMVGHVDVTRLRTGEVFFVLLVLLNHRRKSRKRSLAFSNIRSKIAQVDVPLFLSPLFFLFSCCFLPLSPWKTLCFTPLKQALATLSKSAVALETAFGLLVDRANEWRSWTLKSNFSLITRCGYSPFGS